MRWSITGAVIGVIAVLAIFARLESEAPTSLEARKLVATELNQLAITRYDDNGRKLEVSQADHAVQLEGESELLLGRLYMEREDEQGVRWQLEAPRGLSETRNDTLVLSGGVTVTRGANVTLVTEQLTIDASTSLAKSTSQATLTSERGVTTGSRLQIDFRDGSAVLQGEVTSSFDKGTRGK
ncbi:MAG: LPS export ABC transporter periplasmic protein LptC [Halieaceae bacterium]|jgi:LPS export ABC transporter protein LptC